MLSLITFVLFQSEVGLSLFSLMLYRAKSMPNALKSMLRALNSLENSTQSRPLLMAGGCPVTFRQPLLVATDSLSPFCHPLSPSNRVHILCGRAFCHPDTLFYDFS